MDEEWNVDNEWGEEEYFDKIITIDGK